MSLDSRYIPVNTFQEVFLDKDSGCGMAGGIVKFYQDDSRLTTKEVFKLSGTPPNYSYVSLGVELTLSSIGTFQDGDGNDVTVYLFPYDDSGNIQLYFATVENAGAISQFTREGFPNLTPGEEDEEELHNYISNPQFLLHHELTADPMAAVSPKETGEIVSGTTIVAEGGWTFNRDSGSTAKDFVTFPEFGSYVSVPSKSPKFSIKVENQVVGTGNTFKDLRVMFTDVNKFASNDKLFTFAFEALSLSGSTSNIDVVLLKHYGVGGDPDKKTILQSIELTTSYTIYDVPFKFGINDGKNIGEGSYVSLVISFPTGNVFQDGFTNFLFTDGDLQITNFPDTTNEKMVTDSLAGQFPVPNYTNENIFLPLVLGPKGFLYDRSIIGTPVFRFDDLLYSNQVHANGEKFRVAAYSSVDLIPFRRLYEIWSQLSAIGLPLYGTGRHEMRLDNVGSIPTVNYDLISNTAGAVTAAADGAIPTGFTFTPVTPNPYRVQITFIPTSSITPGSYFTYHTTDARKYIVWQEIGGVGTQPAESADVYIKVATGSGTSASGVAINNALAINGYSFAVPDTRGYFFRDADMGVGRDPDAASRAARGDTTTGDNVGTTQSDEFASHIHNHTHTMNRTYDEVAETGKGYQSESAGFGNIRTDTTSVGGASTGGDETRPINIYVRVAIYI